MNASRRGRGQHTDRLVLHGMHFTAFHGPDLEPLHGPRPFIVDVEVVGDFQEAAARDELDRTVDLRDVYAATRAVVEGERLHILEAIAERVAQAILRLPRAQGVTVRVRTPDARVGGPVDYEAVEITRTR